jgi:hypothetical protein
LGGKDKKDSCQIFKKILSRFLKKMSRFKKKKIIFLSDSSKNIHGKGPYRAKID